MTMFDIKQKIIAEGYREPDNKLLLVTPLTAKLYQIEEIIEDKILDAAEEVCKIKKYKSIYKEGLPDELFALLDMFDHKASLLAALKFIEVHFSKLID